MKSFCYSEEGGQIGKPLSFFESGDVGTSNSGGVCQVILGEVSLFSSLSNAVAYHTAEIGWG